MAKAMVFRLIVDLRDGAAVMQAHSVGMHVDRHAIAAALQRALGEDLKWSTTRANPRMPGKMRDAQQDEYLLAAWDVVPHIVMENSNKFFVDWEEG